MGVFKGRMASECAKQTIAAETEAKIARPISTPTPNTYMTWFFSVESKNIAVPPLCKAMLPIRGAKMCLGFGLSLFASKAHALHAENHMFNPWRIQLKGSHVSVIMGKPHTAAWSFLDWLKVRQAIFHSYPEIAQPTPHPVFQLQEQV